MIKTREGCEYQSFWMIYYEYHTKFKVEIIIIIKIKFFYKKIKNFFLYYQIVKKSNLITKKRRKKFKLSKIYLLYK